MKVLISFDESSDVQEHTAHMDILPRVGDLLHLPDVSNRGLYPVKRTIFVLSRTQSGEAILAAPEKDPSARIELGALIEID
jgi:hypothetical protein